MPRKAGRISGISEITVAAVKSRYQSQVDRLRQPSSGEPMGWAAADLILFEARRAWSDMQAVSAPRHEEARLEPPEKSQAKPKPKPLTQAERDQVLRELGY